MAVSWSERALADRERETRHIIESAEDAFISIDARGMICDWNAQAVATFGWTREEAVGRVLSQTIIPERFRDAHERGLQRILETGEGRVVGKRLELVALDRAGREFPVELTISPLQRAGGYVFYAFLHDITARTQADELLERRRRQLAEAQSVAQLGSWEWNVSQMLSMVRPVRAAYDYVVTGRYQSLERWARRRRMPLTLDSWLCQRRQQALRLRPGQREADVVRLRRDGSR